MYRRVLYVFLIFALVSSACSFSIGSPDPTAAPVPTNTEAAVVQPAATVAPDEPEASPTPAAPEGAVTSLDDVKSATIQIEAEGSFVHPEFGMVMNAAGRGSGFIIDPEGIAITNNHVVTGSALLKVYIGGETKPRNAKVLGVSECSDLAVIDIDGSGYPYLQWYEGDLKVGMDVYAAGFPLGDPEYTLTRGILSKESVVFDSNWTSFDNAIMHDATTNPGNSGGPLVTPDGKLVAVNFAGNSNTNQYFSIARSEAMPVIDILRGGENHNSLGINGEAVMSEDGSISGIWVSSVKSGSPADKAGLKGGDIVTHLENVVLSTDGTMADYCDILRSHNPTDTLNISVLRFAEMAFMEGQINGRPLAASMSFAQELGEEVDAGTTGDTGSATYSEYILWEDATGAIQVELPAEWVETDGSIWETTWGDFMIEAPSISGAANLDNYLNTWDESGVFFAASSDMGKTGGYLQLLYGTRDWYKDECKLESTTDYVDDLYEGSYDLWKNCGPNDTYTLVLSARPKENKTEFLVLIEMRITKDADLDALDHILNSFVVVGDV